MKKGIFILLIFTLGAFGVFAKSPPNKEIKKVGQFQWKWTAADSLDILLNPFIFDSPLKSPIPNPPDVNYWDGTLVTPDQPLAPKQYIINGDTKQK